MPKELGKKGKYIFCLMIIALILIMYSSFNLVVFDDGTSTYLGSNSLFGHMVLSMGYFVIFLNFISIICIIESKTNIAIVLGIIGEILLFSFFLILFRPFITIMIGGYYIIIATIGLLIVYLILLTFFRHKMIKLSEIKELVKQNKENQISDDGENEKYCELCGNKIPPNQTKCQSCNTKS